MYCPIDNTAFAPAPLGQRHIHRCGTCHGAFVPHDVFPEIRAFSALKFHQRGRPTGSEAGALAPARVACPSDKNQMSAFLFKGVEIDVCPKCLGVWLDAGELEKIAALIGQPRETDPSKQNSRLESLEDALDVLDTATDFDPSILDGVLDFVTDALGSIFDGISL